MVKKKGESSSSEVTDGRTRPDGRKGRWRSPSVPHSSSAAIGTGSGRLSATRSSKAVSIPPATDSLARVPGQWETSELPAEIKEALDRHFLAQERQRNGTFATKIPAAAPLDLSRLGSDSTRSSCSSIASAGSPIAAMPPSSCPTAAPPTASSATSQTATAAAAAAADAAATKPAFKHKHSSKDINKIDQYGWTKLRYAAFEGDSQNVLKYISSGANVNVTDHTGQTPLHWAAKKGHTDVVTTLIAHGADHSAHCLLSYTALHYAAVYRHAETCKELTDYGADPNARTKNDKSPLVRAVDGGSVDCVAVLFDAGATFDFKKIVDVACASKCFVHAVAANNCSVMSVLLAMQMNINGALCEYQHPHVSQEMQATVSTFQPTFQLKTVPSPLPDSPLSTATPL